MGRLYDVARQVIDHIDRQDVDTFRTRGAIAMKTGFLVTLVEPDSPDDPDKLARLIAASEQVLGLKIDV